MLRKITLCLIVSCCCLDALWAQQSEKQQTVRAILNAYKKRFNAGERKASFIKEYMKYAQKERSISDLELITDTYLQRIPFKKRYKDENWNLFVDGIKNWRATSFRDLMSNWDQLDEELKAKVKTIVPSVYRSSFFIERAKNKLDPEFAAVMKEDLKKIKSSDLEYQSALLDMALAADNGKVQDVVSLFKKYADKDRLSGLNGLCDLAVMGHALGKVLELADKDVCKEMIDCLAPFVDSKTKQGLFRNLYGSFKGKLMTLDKNTVFDEGQQEMKYVENVDGFYFNTSVGGVMTEKEYAVLRKVFSSSNDSLKREFLHKVAYVFRYNGMTPGLEGIKPLILKNVKPCPDKEKVLSLYNTYAHLAPGKVAPEFKLKDVNGKEYALSDYRGKVVIVDVWATWCGGCIAKLPYFLKLRDKYKDRDDIIFMTISIDRKSAYNTWKYALPRYNLTDIISLIAIKEESDFTKIYNVTGIPRYFIIDKDGTIVTVYAPNPNNLKLDQMIQEVLDKK